MTTAKRRRSRSPPATASSPYFPPELIPEVASGLTSLQDLFALRASCRAYRALLPLTSSNLASQAPLLLVGTGSMPYALFHPTLRRIHRFRLPRTLLANNGDYISTKFHQIGCRLAICETEFRSLGEERRTTRNSFSIVHLLTGERTCISSPPNRVFRVLLSGDLVLTLTCNSPETIQYCHLEAADWCVAAVAQPYSLEDLLYVNGVLYALVEGTLRYRLAVVELSENDNSVELVFLGGYWDAGPLVHLAECCGELILIELVEVEPRACHVFQWKFGDAKWVRITSLGGCTLFVADDHFVGCLGPDHRGIRGDSVYVIEDSCGGWCEYSLLDGSFIRSDPKYSRAEVPSKTWAFTWLLPSLF
ncbi:hypothetical protein U9M48_037901 [Paspalum notatum var. saurae]|uniref:KIB1-4 beta-propeller domain-containing protein n=1 Tax=Paspalum notatum var. saurae TaxID=547442 RepID=A0AAQ3UK87_PASNO